MMTNVRTSLCLTLLLGALSVVAVQAQSPEVKAARETVEKAQQSAEESVEARQKALSKILDLTDAEIADILGEKKLGAALTTADAGLTAAAKDLRARLIMYREYVSLTRAELMLPRQTSDSLKEIAAEFKDWREQEYQPIVRQALDAILLTHGTEVISIAQRRLDRVSADIKKLPLDKQHIVKALLPHFESAREHVVAAGARYQEARTLFRDTQVYLHARALGTLQSVILARGSAGDFVCLPGKEPLSGGACPLAFKRATGGYYALKTPAGEPFVAAIGDVARVEGVLVTVASIADSVTGALFVERVNATSGASELETSSLLEVADENDAEKKSVQHLMKQILDDAEQAYKDFFSMSKKAQQLLAK